MKSYLFFTADGCTYDNSNKLTNNMQVLGHGVGNDVDEAFKSFKIHQSYIYKQNYKNIMAIETIGDVITNLEV